MVGGAGVQMMGGGAGGQMVGAGVQHYSTSASLPATDQQLNFVPQSYSVHSKGIQDPRQQKMLEQQQQQQRMGAVLNPAFIKQVQVHTALWVQC